MRTVNVVELNQPARSLKIGPTRGIIVSLFVAACLHSAILFSFQCVALAEPQFNEPMFRCVFLDLEHTCSIPGLVRPVISAKLRPSRSPERVPIIDLTYLPSGHIKFDDQFESTLDADLFSSSFAPSMSFVDLNDDDELSR